MTDKKSIWETRNALALRVMSRRGADTDAVQQKAGVLRPTLPSSSPFLAQAKQAQCKPERGGDGHDE
jgi:hypothetical protein